MIREQEERTAAAARNRLSTLIADSMLRARFLDKTFANFLPFGKDREKQLYVLSVAKDFTDDFDRHQRIGTWLLFMGHVGGSLFSKSELMDSMAFGRVIHSQVPPARHAPRKGRGRAELGYG